MIKAIALKVFESQQSVMDNFLPMSFGRWGCFSNHSRIATISFAMASASGSRNSSRILADISPLGWTSDIWECVLSTKKTKWKQKRKKRGQWKLQNEIHWNKLHKINGFYVLLANQGKRVHRPFFSCFSSARFFPALHVKKNFANWKVEIFVQSKIALYSMFILWHQICYKLEHFIYVKICKALIGQNKKKSRNVKLKNTKLAQTTMLKPRSILSYCRNGKKWKHFEAHRDHLMLSHSY